MSALDFPCTPVILRFAMASKNNRFIDSTNLLIEAAERGSIEWMSKAEVTGAQQLMIARVEMEPGQMHGFHYHPQREEAIYVLEGRLEQWIEGESKILGPGEVAHIPADMVHATFTLPDTPVKFLAILSPCQFESGEVEFMFDVSDQSPWREHLASRSPMA